MKISLEECKEKMNNRWGDLYLRSTNITELPNDLVVNGDLYLRNTKITELPNDLILKGSLYVSYTNITELPNDLVVNGSLYLSNSSITELPSNLVVNGDLDLRNTNITELPKDLVVQYRIYSDKDLDKSNVKKLNDGDYVEGSYLYADNILTHIKSKKRILDKYDYFIGKIKDENVIYDGKYYAHCKNIKDGITDLEFKYAKDRGLNQFNDLDLESVLNFNECKNLYRIITGACKQGTESFILTLGKKKKDKYSIKELIYLTKNQYGNETLVKFFNK